MNGPQLHVNGVALEDEMRRRGATRAVFKVQRRGGSMSFQTKFVSFLQITDHTLKTSLEEEKPRKSQSKAHV
jgi:hypothetical protein